jgi:aldose 1-epimerase
MNTIEVVELENENGMKLKISNYGATIISLQVPDRANKLVNVVAGLQEPSNYIEKPYTDVLLFLGCSIGRYAGRISKGKFEVEGKSYNIENENGVHLHGGKGFDLKYWKIEKVSKTKTKSSVVLSYFSKDKEEGYPGNLKAEVEYCLTNKNQLQIIYKATTDKATPVNLTNHAYYNLNGGGTILDHDLYINSKRHLEVDSRLVPTGKIKKSKNTNFDYNEKANIKKDTFIGLDDTFVLSKGKLKAVLYSAKTGINMNVYTNQPAMVVFTHKKFPELPFNKATVYKDYPAICFETQNYPDAPHNSNFPNSILSPEKEYLNKSIFEFSVI